LFRGASAEDESQFGLLVCKPALIRDRLLLHALSASYQNLIPRRYPFALLFLDCDAGKSM